MNFNDETKFKKLVKFSGFCKRGTSPKDLAYYEASDGYFISCDGELWDTAQGKPKKFTRSDKDYQECRIKLKDGKFKSTTLHRLVATCWVEGFNPEEDKILVNHIDENKQNNHPSNLEWCTNEYNINYGTRIERTSKSMKETCNRVEYREKVKERWQNPEYQNKMSQANKKAWQNSERRNNMSQTSKSLWKNPEYKDKLSKSNKEYWKNPEHKEKVAQAFRKPVALFHLDGTVYKVFGSRGEASAYAMVHQVTVTNWVKSRKTSKCGKFYWDYYNKN